MNIFELFTPKAQTFYLTESMTLRQALEKFDNHKFSVVPVISEDGKYITTLSQGDILRYIKNRGRFSLEMLEDVNIMSIEHYRPYQACRNTLDMADVVQLGLQQNFIPIVDDRDMYIGIVKRKDIILRLVVEKD